MGSWSYARIVVPLIMLFAMTEGESRIITVEVKLIVIEGVAPLEALAVAVAVCSLTSLPASEGP